MPAIILIVGFIIYYLVFVLKVKFEIKEEPQCLYYEQIETNLGKIAEKWYQPASRAGYGYEDLRAYWIYITEDRYIYKSYDASFMVGRDLILVSNNRQKCIEWKK